MAIKPPDGHLDWVTDDDADKFIAPSTTKRLQGWVKQEKPPFQYFNWAWRLVDRWLKWNEAQSDENAAAIAAHANATAVHGATSEAMPNRIFSRDANGRGKVAAPSDPNDIARKAEIDAHAALNNPHNATASPTASRIAMFTSGGRLQSGAAASAANDCVRKAELDALIPAAIYRGRVNWDGSAGNPWPSGWSVSRTDTGVYEITHNLNAYIVPILTAATTSNDANVIASSVGVNSLTVRVFYQGNPSNTGFALIIMK